MAGPVAWNPGDAEAIIERVMAACAPLGTETAQEAMSNLELIGFAVANSSHNLN